MIDFPPIMEIEREWMRDFRKFANDNLKIQTMEGELIDFQVNEVQDIVLDIFHDIQERGRLIRVIILKARREGISTLIEGRNYWHTSTKANRYSMVITHEPEATDFLFNMVRRYQSFNEYRPEEKYNNKKILEFNDETGKRGLDSAIRVGTAGKEDFGAGQLTHYLHLSELAKYPQHAIVALLTGIMQTVPDHKDTEVVIESTGKGIGGEFYIRYWQCRYSYEVYLGSDGKPTFRVEVNEDAPEDNEYSRIFIPWFVFSKYQREPKPDFKRYAKADKHETYADEEHLVEMHGLTDKHLAWRRWCIENKCGGSLDKFKQEYPSNAREAFLASGTPVFNVTQCETLKKFAPKPIARYEVMLSSGQWIARPNDGRLKVWKEPVPGRSYVIAADVAEGLETGDFDSADVVDQLTGEQFAQWHGKLDPDQFAKVLGYLGYRYNTAWMVPERNFHGLTVLQKLFDAGYPKLYSEKIDDPPNRPRKRYGWHTSKKSKPELVDNLVAEMRDNTHNIKCAATFEEMMSYKQVPGEKVYGAESGMFDDRVISIAIAKFTRTKFPPPSAYTGGVVVREVEPSPNA